MTYFRRFLIVALLLAPLLTSAQTNVYCCNGGPSGWPSTAQNLVWASPDGVAGNPLFRSLVAADLPADTLDVSDLPWLDVTLPPFNAACDAEGSTGTDDTAAIQAAADVFGPHVVYIPRSCLISDSILINQNRVHVVGAGRWVGVLTMVPAAAGTPMLVFERGPGLIIYQNTVRDIKLKFMDAELQQIGIRAIDSSELHVYDTVIHHDNWGTGGSNSIGIQIRGRDKGIIRGTYIATDGIPLSIEDNPNHSLDLDGWRFHDNTYISKSNVPLINIAGGVNYTNNFFDGENVAAGGVDMFRAVDTTTAQFSYNLKISGFRWEQAVGDGWFANIQANHGLRMLELSNNHMNGDSGGFTSKGVRLRGVTGANILGSLYEHTSTCYDIDGTNHHVYFGNFQCIGGSTITTTGATLTRYEGDSVDNTEPNHPFEWWESSANANIDTQSFVRRMQVGTSLGIGTIANTTVGRTLDLLSSGSYSTVLDVSNLDATGTATQAVIRTTASGTQQALRSYGPGNSALGFGVTLGSYSALALTSGNALIVGTQNAAPVIVGTSGQARMTVATGGGVTVDGFATALRSITVAYTAVATDHTILADTTLASYSVFLPTCAAASNGRVYLIKKTAAGNTLTLDPAGSETIDNAATLAMTTTNQSRTIQCNGTAAAWFITAGYL